MEKLDKGTFVSFGIQFANVLTKGLSVATFQSIVGNLGMDDIRSPT